MKKYYDSDLISNINYLIDMESLTEAKKQIDEYKKLYPNDMYFKMVEMKYLNAISMFSEAENLGKSIEQEKFRNDDLKSKLFINISTSLFNQEKYDEAILYAKKAIKANKGKFFHQYKYISDIYIKKYDLENAKKILEDNINNINHDLFNLNIGYISFLQKNYNTAIDTLLTCDDKKINNKVYIQKKYCTIGSCYVQLNKYEEALKFLRNALTVKGYLYYIAQYNIAICKYQLGHIEEAIKICEDALKNYKYEPIEELLSDLYLKSGNLSKNNKLLNNIEDESEKNYNLGKSYIFDNKFKEAIIVLNKALKNANECLTTKIFYQLVIAYFKIGDYANTLRYINLINEANDMIKYDLNRIKFYINYHIGLETSPEFYTAKQIVNYDENLALNHILRRHENDFNTKMYNIEELFYEIQDYLIDSNKYNYIGFDMYKITMENIGSKNNSQVLSVICLPNTKNILTMYPDLNPEFILDDLEIESYETKNSKRRKLSQIEKFNLKYNK